MLIIHRQKAMCRTKTGIAPSRYLFEPSGSFSRHTRTGGHPAFSAKHFWVPACAGMTKFE
jgi:hypothetical protein